jgi:hypothetical protein
MRKIILFASLVLSINSFSQIPPNGLVGYWPFNGNAYDESGNGHDGTVDGPTLTTDRFGKANSAYYFNGIHKIVTTFQGVGGDHDRSISFWVKTGTLPAGYICYYGGGFGTSFNPLVNITDAGIDISNSTLHYKSASNSDEWHHFVFIFSTQYGTSLNGLKIYRDKVLLSEVSGGYNSTAYAINTSLSNFTMGAASAVQYYLDDVRFYNSVLSQSEISALYNENICVQSITVTDTLIINANLTGFDPVKYSNTIKVFPNPTKDAITIDCGNNYSTLNGYTIKITNSLSQTVYTSLVNQQSTTIDLGSWTGRGIYFVHLIDASNNTIDIRKIVLQ